MSDKVDRSPAATHGKPFAASFHESDDEAPAGQVTESDGTPLAIPLLNEAIERSGLPRKQVAALVGKSEATFSKMTTTGPNAQAFGLDAFEQLPVGIQVAWLKRYAHSIGLEVRELDALAVAQALVERFEDLERFIRMYRIGRPRMASMALQGEALERRRA